MARKPIAAPKAAEDAIPAKRRPGRPSPGDTVQVTLRIPRDQLAQLAEEAGRRSVEVKRNITAQAVILDMIAAGLAPDGKNTPGA
jgi:hypothetical protein